MIFFLRPNDGQRPYLLVQEGPITKLLEKLVVSSLTISLWQGVVVVSVIVLLRWLKTFFFFFHNCPLVIVVLAISLTRLATPSTLLLVIDHACFNYQRCRHCRCCNWSLPTAVWLCRRIASHYRLLFLLIVAVDAAVVVIISPSQAGHRLLISRTAVEKKEEKKKN